ncbi:MAG: ribonuclease HII [Actinobacteria bacterium]|nr:ribonuclease HII [Actinomycetota bacterium]
MRGRTVADIRSALEACAAEDVASLTAEFAGDSRAGVASAVERARRRAGRHAAELTRLESLAAIERRMNDEGLVVAGVDEVGRGALAGPVTAGACVFEGDIVLEGLTDSKKLSASRRSSLNIGILGVATATCVAHSSAAEIDAVGIAAATALAMRRAVAGLGIDVDHILVDGHPVSLGRPSTSIIRGDATVRAIAAAAIVAKVARDALMVELDAEYPGYGLAANKGYGSADHLEAIARIGPCPIHRRSFGPCNQPSLF